MDFPGNQLFTCAVFSCYQNICISCCYLSHNVHYVNHGRRCSKNYLFLTSFYFLFQELIIVFKKKCCRSRASQFPSSVYCSTELCVIHWSPNNVDRSPS